MPSNANSMSQVTEMDVKTQILTPLLETLIKEENIEVPMLPEVANKAVTLAQDPESDANQMAQLITGDQSLAAHVMRIANSAAYTPNASLVSLQQAIARLGMGLISEIAVAASIGTKMFHTPGYEQHIAYIWKHALASALWAKEISRTCRRNVESSFLCGLLHSIGRPVAVQAILDLSQKKGLEIQEAEVFKVEDLYHQKIAMQVLTTWGMPELIKEVVNFYHDYHAAPNATGQIANARAAAAFATHMLRPEDMGKGQLVELEVLGDLNLYADEVEDLLDKTDVVKASVEEMSL
ncbi:HDOD domain-containing protein [Pseudoteredinibacter isoporae]|uniref:HDOD domain-containing protein n=1 Tax=Pseudoteredinibacter isoporae TaxID=570281 RepID=UPI003105AED0